MADYFAALAARTLQPALSVQPRQRVRWEEPAEPAADVFVAAEKKIADGARPPVLDDAEPPRRSRRQLTPETSSQEGEAPAPPSGPRRSKRKTAGDQDEANAAPPSAPHPTVRAIEPTVQVRFEAAAARSRDVRGTGAAVAGDRSRTTVRASDIDRARPLPARLSQRERESAAEPAIRIHIGRVDVRAVMSAAPGPSPSASRDSKRALMSLDEYVQKRDRGAS